MTMLRYAQSVLGGVLVDTVDGLDIWRFLEPEEPFPDWIRARIQEFGFRKGVDFEVVFSFLDDSGEGPVVTYSVTIDMAKELIIVEMNDKGRRAREYVINCGIQVAAATKAGGFTSPILVQSPPGPRQALERIMRQAEGQDSFKPEAPQEVVIETLVNNPDLLRKALNEINENRRDEELQHLETEAPAAAIEEAKVTELKDPFAGLGEGVTIPELAKLLGISEDAAADRLVKHGLAYWRADGTLQPTQQAIDDGDVISA